MVTTASLKDVLLDSAREVFETMVFMAVTESDQNSPDIEEMVKPVTLLGSVTFRGSLEGCLGVRCDAACARTIAARMLGVDVTERLSEADICDAIGEVANMVLGVAKSRLQNEVGGIEVSIPSVFRGRELQNGLGAGASMVTLSVDIGRIYTAEFSLQYRTGRKSLSDRFTELLRSDTRGAKEDGQDRRAAPSEEAKTRRTSSAADGPQAARTVKPTPVQEHDFGESNEAWRQIASGDGATKPTGAVKLPVHKAIPLDPHEDDLMDFNGQVRPIDGTADATWLGRTGGPSEPFSCRWE